MLHDLHWLSHFVFETTTIFNTISQMTALHLTARLVGVSGSEGQALELVLKGWSILLLGAGNVMISQEKGTDGL